MKQLAQRLFSLALVLALVLGISVQSAQALSLQSPLLAVAEAEIRNEADAQRIEAGGKLDLNNIGVRAFQQFPGMYPYLASKIVLGGPYDSVDDVLKLDLSDRQREVFEQYKENFTVTPPRDALNEGDDRINNGIYR
ncbi:photosystem II complex extrinsic protein PsbU [Synechococcus elongatus]|uniref:Photosystem II extrinsic protein U n=2 Tax=Synechococcus elongatus TaxID=32046 RepID=PSBU_SYNE7|nr:photosystem II complex extrinsic protein PsbU [Synechococcus elongatus]Q31M07.1 RecName: Full=Photosystem II extrinsic protein U; Short=PSII-U; Short=PsbU; AltName: Full=Photosystem II 12 kDa extrinsic protein; Short=PS II complex 12 kDa extrinsic protein; Flags: Precursor [Synechococcus elongatus PCC 7942 = FACHB-805]Q5MZW7.1 RecName: Full=Photosystem II extrinsic protein U; Short=PSII-U; Short=PsbU; AltName: Full=Photosystem II 12 kDa extrinsic protein; Short=PS II complex 12 kDa extrinsic p